MLKLHLLIEQTYCLDGFRDKAIFVHLRNINKHILLFVPLSTEKQVGKRELDSGFNKGRAH